MKWFIGTSFTGKTDDWKWLSTLPERASATFRPAAGSPSSVTYGSSEIIWRVDYQDSDTLA